MLPPELLATIGCVLLLAVLAGLAARYRAIRRSRTTAAKRTRPVSTLIVLGSGGHTAEMLHIVGALDAQRYRPRVYVCAATDRLSASAAERLEAGRPAADYSIVRVQRSRHVHQSYVSAVWTTARAFLCDSVPLLWTQQPGLVLCNGPGTCVPVAVAAWALRAVGRLSVDSRVVFVESFCRVRSVSLSGRLLRPLADLFVVQWPELADGGAGTYVGKLM